MKKREKKTAAQRIKVRLDDKTTLVIRKLKSFKLWKQRYPMAEIIS